MNLYLVMILNVVSNFYVKCTITSRRNRTMSYKQKQTRQHSKRHEVTSTIESDKENQYQNMTSQANQISISEPARYYSRREEFCLEIQFNQTISHRGCIPKTITNKLCHGFCDSVVVPKGTKNPGSVRICTKSKVKIRFVKLKCSTRKKGYKLKPVQIVKACSCSTQNVRFKWDGWFY